MILASILDLSPFDIFGSPKTTATKKIRENEYEGGKLKKVKSTAPPESGTGVFLVVFFCT